jgi:hypothetical protein
MATILVIAAEFAFGLGLILGVLTRAAALGLLFTMIGAILAVHLGNGLFAENGGWEYPLTLSLVAFLFVVRGGGIYSFEPRLHDTGRSGRLFAELARGHFRWGWDEAARSWSRRKIHLTLRPMAKRIGFDFVRAHAELLATLQQFAVGCSSVDSDCHRGCGRRALAGPLGRALRPSAIGRHDRLQWVRPSRQRRRWRHWRWWQALSLHQAQPEHGLDFGSSD